MSTEPLADVSARLRRPLWRLPLADQLAVLADGEAIAAELLGASRWTELVPLAGLLSEALAIVDEAIAEDPSDAWLVCARALSSQALGRDREARTEAQRSLTIARRRGERFAAKVEAKLGDLATRFSDDR